MTVADRIIGFLLSEDDFEDEEDYREVWGPIPNDAVLLIPEPDEDEPPPFGITPGYYSQSQLVALLARFHNQPNAIQFIADMLESGNPDDDQFVQILRQNKHNPAAIARIVQAVHQAL